MMRVTRAGDWSWAWTSSATGAGGCTTPSDTCSGWLDLFRDLGYNKDDLEELVLKGVDRPLLMKAEADEALARDIALRYEEAEENVLF